MNKLVSIITPSYNSSQFISYTIESVLAQTYTNWELLITDDCSTDTTINIVKGYAAKDSRIKLFFLNHNQGAAAARNTCLVNAQGRYIAFLDSDDVWDKKKLELQLIFMQTEECGFSYTNYFFVTEDNVNTGLIKSKKQTSYKSLLKNTSIACSTVMIDRGITGDFRMPDIRSSQDLATWLQLLKKGIFANCLCVPLTSYRVANDSLSSKKVSSSKSVWKVYREVEQLSALYATYCFVNYIINATFKRIKGYYLYMICDRFLKPIHFFMKRLMDIILSIIAIIFFIPILIVVAIFIKADSKGPVFFIQNRLGKNGKVFKIFKFRSMVVDAEFNGTGIFNMNNDDRVTKIGKILRDYSIDELPQLFNILIGDMSFIGPRPPITYELGDFNKLDFTTLKRFNVKPGVSGYAQTNGRNELNWDEKIVFDNKYIDDFNKYGIFVDIKVILITIIKVLKNEGAYELEEKVVEDQKRLKR